MNEWTYTPPQTPLRIEYQDEEVIVVDKPAGLLSVPGKAAHHQDCLQNRLLDIEPSALLVHRLDCDTSGLIIFAKTPAAQRHLGLQFEKRIPKKTYLAWVLGVPADSKGQIDLPIIVDWPNRPMQKICHETGRAAMTQWRKIRSKTNQACLKLQPATGRSHQLRIHCREIGHPIIGDPLYGGGANEAKRMMLHAQKLEFRHPIGGEFLTVICDPPSEFGPGTNISPIT